MRVSFCSGIERETTLTSCLSQILAVRLLRLTHSFGILTEESFYFPDSCAIAQDLISAADDSEHLLVQRRLLQRSFEVAAGLVALAEPGSAQSAMSANQTVFTAGAECLFNLSQGQGELFFGAIGVRALAQGDACVVMVKILGRVGTAGFEKIIQRLSAIAHFQIGGADGRKLVSCASRLHRAIKLLLGSGRLVLHQKNLAEENSNLGTRR